LRCRDGDKGAQAALALADDPSRFLSKAQIGTTLVGILAGAFGGVTIAEELGAALGTYPPLAWGHIRFCNQSHRWLERQDVVVRFEFPAGDRMFVDFCKRSCLDRDGHSKFVSTHAQPWLNQNSTGTELQNSMIARPPTPAPTSGFPAVARAGLGGSPNLANSGAEIQFGSVPVDHHGCAERGLARATWLVTVASLKQTN
jgi:hypothetical protein